ncbi:RmlC-like cupin domain-containing protein [Cladochytrium replicatum]|nr:RmlC-like cupin domain-containing protein [Cladochytrium replicatum]
MLLQLLKPKLKELVEGGTKVRRVLPSVPIQAVGSFIFLDHMGPTSPGLPLDVGPHPHIGLSTVTYLFSGALQHYDSLGTSEVIRPGDINFMTAGRGIVHSERPVPTEKIQPLEGIQFWCALPPEHEETNPDFQHVASLDIPSVTVGSSKVNLLISPKSNSPFDLFGKKTSPVNARDTSTLYAAVEFRGEDVVHFRGNDAEERAVYAADPDGVTILDDSINGASPVVVPQYHLAVIKPGISVRVRGAGNASRPSRAIILGGNHIAHRYIWWNYVSTIREGIEDAKAHWGALTQPDKYPTLRAGLSNRFTIIPDDNQLSDYIPQPPPRA